MNVIKDIYNEYKFIIIIILISIIYLSIYYNLLYNELNNYIQKNWHKINKNPIIAPFAGFFNKGSGKNSFNSSVALFINKFIGLFLKPFVYFLKLITKSIYSIKNSLDKFRNMAAVMRNLFKHTVESTVERIQNSMAAIRYYQEKYKLLIRKQTAILTMFQYFTKSLKYLFYSFSKGPIPKMVNFATMYLTMAISFLAICLLCVIGGPFIGMIACPICLICFDEDTLIKLDDINYKKIKDLRLDENINNGGKILGKLKIKCGNTPMYNYKGIKVSGSHLVKENNKWIRVEDSNLSKLITYDNNKNIYCLITENNIIETKETIFADYQETNNPSINSKISKIIENHLNKKPLDIYENSEYTNNYYWGFDENTPIDCYNGKIKSLKYLKIGDRLNWDTYVLGIVELTVDNISLYKYKGISVSGNQLIFEGGTWKRVKNLSKSIKIPYKKDKKLYHVITNNNKFYVKNIRFTDFCETNNNKVNDIIDTMVEDFKNL